MARFFVRAVALAGESNLDAAQVYRIRSPGDNKAAVGAWIVKVFGQGLRADLVEVGAWRFLVTQLEAVMIAAKKKQPSWC